MGREVVRLSALNETEGEAAAAAPFLYARLRSRISTERRRREEGESWLALLTVVWRAVPAMALVAIFAFALFWTQSLGTKPAGIFSVEQLLDTRDAGIEQVVFNDRQPLSSDDVLATILSNDERETAK
jgi:anti-sigma-K factor RskA